MKRLRPPSRIRTGGAALALCAVPVVVAGALAAPAQATTGASSLAVSPTGSVLVAARGNGHGHGMSQYGARGAAMRGLSYPRILAFYYQHARLGTTKHTRIRVLLSGYGSRTTVSARPALTLTGVAGSLSTAARRYRLVAGAHNGLTLQRLPLAAGSHWTTIRTGLPDKSAFHATNWNPMTIFSPDGTSAAYYGRLRAIRSGGGVKTVNAVSIDRYTAGVVPYEMPSSWQPAAVRAQAVAARTYGVYAVEHPRSSDYDICDTTSCQVYGGYAQRNRYGNTTAQQYLPAATSTTNRVLTYGGRAIFAQFSASNGGWEISGGQPYLRTRRDPYDTARAGDPYAYYTRKVRVQSLASWFGFGRLTRISVTGRDGYGQWGGRVGGVVLSGTDKHGKAKRVSTDGSELSYALGLGTTWFNVTNAK